MNWNILLSLLCLNTIYCTATDHSDNPWSLQWEQRSKHFKTQKHIQNVTDKLITVTFNTLWHCNYFAVKTEEIWRSRHKRSTVASVIISLMPLEKMFPGYTTDVHHQNWPPNPQIKLKWFILAWVSVTESTTAEHCISDYKRDM